MEATEPNGTLEVTAADYSHEFVAEADLTVSAPGERPSTLSNDLPVEFGTTTSDWGTVSHAALWADDVSGANEAPYTATVALGNSGAAPSGITVRINAGELNFSLD